MTVVALGAVLFPANAAYAAVTWYVNGSAYKGLWYGQGGFNSVNGGGGMSGYSEATLTLQTYAPSAGNVYAQASGAGFTWVKLDHGLTSANYFARCRWQAVTNPTQARLDCYGLTNGSGHPTSGPWNASAASSGDKLQVQLAASRPVDTFSDADALGRLGIQGLRPDSARYLGGVGDISYWVATDESGSICIIAASGGDDPISASACSLDRDEFSSHGLAIALAVDASESEVNPNIAYLLPDGATVSPESEGDIVLRSENLLVVSGSQERLPEVKSPELETISLHALDATGRN